MGKTAADLTGKGLSSADTKISKNPLMAKRAAATSKAGLSQRNPWDPTQDVRPTTDFAAKVEEGPEALLG